jgi:uncharacterized protein YjbI with pentapeptide repeats
MEQSKLNKILDDHKLWLQTNGKQGEQADLRYADLSYANLSYADLRYANLSYANLSYADLSYAYMSYADLRYANLDFSAFPLWCGGLSVHIDDKQAKQLLYHLIQNVQYSKNTSKTLKKLLLTKTIIKKANEFHRIGEDNIKEIKEE